MSALPVRTMHATSTSGLQDKRRQRIVRLTSREQKESIKLTFNPGFLVKLPFNFIIAPLILSPTEGLRRCVRPVVVMPWLRPLVAGPWAPELVAFVDEDNGPVPLWPWWPRPCLCVVVFRVVVVLPVMGLVEVVSVTRAGCCFLRPPRRERRPGLRPVVVVGVAVVRWRTMVGRLCVCDMYEFVVSVVYMLLGFVEQTRTREEAWLLPTYLSFCCLCVISKRCETRMTADVGLCIESV